MKYKDIIGYGKKKKVSKQKPKPKVNKVLESIKKEFGYINEGPAYDWAKVYSKAEKAYMEFQKAIDELGRFTTKNTGEKTDQKIFEKQWKKQVVPFYKLMKSWISGKL